MHEINAGGFNSMRSNTNLTGQNAALVVENYQFTDPLTITSHVKVVGKLIFRNCIFQKGLIINSDPSVSRIEFDRCTFKETVQIDPMRFELSFESGCQFDKDLVLNGSLQNLQIGNFIIKGSLFVRGGYLTLVLLNINASNIIGFISRDPHIRCRNKC